MCCPTLGEDDLGEPKVLPLDDSAHVMRSLRAGGWCVYDPAGQHSAAKLVRLAEMTRTVRFDPAYLGLANVRDGIADATSVDVADAVRRAAKHRGVSAVDGRVVDLAAMAAAKPLGDTGLFDYQRRFVGVAEATAVGVVNGIRVGRGKTPSTAVAMAVRATHVDSYRGLCVVPADKIGDWCDELGDWFPQAAAVAVYDSREMGEALAAVDAAGSDPAVLVISHEMARRQCARLALRRWDDLVADEASLLWNPRGKRAAALWQLRQVSKRAMALLGRTYDRSLDQMAAVVAFTRNDLSLADTSAVRRIGGELATSEGRTKLLQAVGPAVFLDDEAGSETGRPTLRPDAQRIEASPAELALAEGARVELKRLYTDLVERIGEAAALDPGDPRFAKIKAELITARGRLIGGVTLARLATSCPEAIAASSSAGAGLLCSAGLVGPAVAAGSTKRRVLTEALGDAVGGGRGAALVFSDFAQVVDNYAEAFAAAGLRSVGLTGKISPRRRQAILRDYHDGHIDVLCLGSVGKRGLNLQKQTTVLVHADMPWTFEPFDQRRGRADRVGAGSKEISEWIPIVSHTIEERVAAALASRGGLAVVLDVAAGRAADGGSADVLRALAGEVDTSSDMVVDFTDMLAVVKAVLV